MDARGTANSLSQNSWNYSGVSGFSGIGTSGFSGFSGYTGFSGLSGTLGTGTFQTLTDVATVSWNYANGYNTVVTLGGNRTLSISNTVNGDYGTIKIIQDGTGSRTLTFPAGSKFQDGQAVFSTAAGAIDIYVFVYDGTNYYWNYNKSYS